MTGQAIWPAILEVTRNSLECGRESSTLMFFASIIVKLGNLTYSVLRNEEPDLYATLTSTHPADIAD